MNSDEKEGQLPIKKVISLYEFRKSTRAFSCNYTKVTVILISKKFSNNALIQNTGDAYICTRS